MHQLAQINVIIYAHVSNPAALVLIGSIFLYT